MTKVFKDTQGWKDFRKTKEFEEKTLGFVPTMGALHEGHFSLIRQSKKENDRTMVSIFVNPTQFNDANDLAKYPRTYDQDLEALKNLEVDYLIFPNEAEMYLDRYRYKVIEKEFSRILCGAHRPDHFDGVLTIVLKLLNLVDADRAYFGEKDYQQYELIRDMAQAFFLKTEIIPCPTVREEDGLALSSRNRLLGPLDRKKAPRFYELLKTQMKDSEVKDRLSREGFQVDYVETIKGRRFGAVHLGSVRLIDNVQI